MKLTFWTPENQRFVLQGELLPNVGQRVALMGEYFLVNEVVLHLTPQDKEDTTPSVDIFLKSVKPPEPIGPGSITKTDFSRLRGLVSRHARCQYNIPLAGALSPEDSKAVREDAEEARIAVYEAIRKMEKGLGL